ncbi:MerR family transcriptional regulator [Actinoplanes sp. NPDC048796]|uniref:helix-turn-helix domain-containing protein n=1 Tax=unclassified Actinoplanes TaxID=2626549 RepID=UPI0033EB9F2E
MWTIDELVERVREALAAEYPGAPNARVRDVPDRRAIRWYTTIGLVDKPSGMRGRTALYGPRHLQQLVTIKRRQALGQSLAQIQAEFAWISPEALRVAAQIPEHLLGDSDGEGGDGPPPDATKTRPRFWTDPPGQQAFHRPPPIVEEARDRPARRATAQPVSGVALEGGVLLIVPRPLTERDRDDIAAAAAPLIDLLAARGLIDGSSV